MERAGSFYSLQVVTTNEHWTNWHSAYEDPNSSISRRLAVVQRRLSETLSARSEGPIRVVSMCAGQGRDVIGVLEGHDRAHDVRAHLIEQDVHLVNDARTRAHGVAQGNIEVHAGDASVTSTYENIVPADILLVCGVFGNITEQDIHATIGLLPTLLATNATVIWTRHRRNPDFTPKVREWFGDFGFEEIAFDTEETALFCVGTYRLIANPQPFVPDRKLFTFIGDGTSANL
jgi:hypothetical protein